MQQTHMQNGSLQMRFAGVLMINKKMAFDKEKVCHQNSSTVHKVATKLNKDIADRIMCASTKISKIWNVRKSLDLMYTSKHIKII